MARDEALTARRSAAKTVARRPARTASLGVGEIPQKLRHRLLSVRACDETAMLVGAEVVAGNELEATIRRLYADSAVSYLHVHNARPGRYDCRVIRA